MILKVPKPAIDIPPRSGITIISFGFNNRPQPADVVIDLRKIIPTPHWTVDVYELKRRYHNSYGPLIVSIADLAVDILETNKESVTIAIGCGEGRHRSVAIAELVKASLSGVINVGVIHRDLGEYNEK